MSIQIVCENVTKKFYNQKIISDFNYTFNSPESYAILGLNGAGKSTLIKLIAGYLTTSSGSINYFDASKLIPPDKQNECISLAAPYIELIEEFTLSEMISFHQKFKPFKEKFSEEDLPSVLLKTTAKKKQINTFSSGMKQRLKLALALFSDTPIVLLDEPTTNLDNEGISWYNAMVKKYVLSENRLLIIASNTETDYHFCKNRLVMGLEK